MRLHILLMAGLGAFGSSPAWCAAQAQTDTAKCQLPPPLVCLPPPPKGPKYTLPQIDSYIGGLDVVIITNQSIAGSVGGTNIGAYVKELRDYREDIVEYRKDNYSGLDTSRAKANAKTEKVPPE